MVDSSPIVAFVQVAGAVGIDRSREPASAGPYTSSGTYQYGSWLVDLDGDGRLDYYAVNHGQWPHLSGLFINDGRGGFGENLFTVAVQPSPDDWAYLGQSNEIGFVGDLTGDGRVDLFFHGWSGYGVVCVNQGNVVGPDWSGPGFSCFATTDILAYGDVNGDGRIDVLAVSPSSFNAYDAYYAHTASYVWRLNDGDPNIQTWPTTGSFLDLRVNDSVSPSPPFLDLNGDGIPDRIVGIPLPPGSRGPYGTLTAGKQVFLGQAGGGYALQTATGLETVTEPIRVIEDVDGDGCLDIGADVTGYRDNLDWYVQDKVNGRCNLTFRLVPRTQLPYYPGFKHCAVDIDNSGLLSQVVLIHGAYGTNDGRPVGVSIYRRLPDGTYAVIPPDQSGIDITDGGTEFYADNLSPGDWDDDGRVDLAGTGVTTIQGTDSGFALWTSRLATSNGWIKISLPTVTGFFTGAATIEVFDAGFVGDPAHLVTPPRRLYTGWTWGSQVHHLGIGTRAAVDVRVTFPDGRETIRAGVAPASRLVIEPSSFPAPIAVVTADPTSVVVGGLVSFDGSGSSAAAGSIVEYRWDFGDGTGATGARVSHAYLAAGILVAGLTVTDDRGATGTATVTITVEPASVPAPVAVVTADPTSAVVGGLVSFDGSASSAAAGSIVEYLWDFGDGTGATGARVSHAYLAAGTFVAGLTVTDDRGATGTATVTITVLDAASDTTAPVTALSAPADGATVAGVTTISATASDDTGVTLLEFLVDGAVVASDATAPYSAVWDSASVADGWHTLVARAHDAAGNVGVSTPVSVLVRNAVGAEVRFVQQSHAVPQKPRATVTVTFTAAQGTGDLNVVVVGWNDTTARVGSVTDAMGNAYQLAIGPTQIAGALSQSIYYAKNIAASAAGANKVTVVFDRPASYADIRVVEYAGIDAVAPLDVAAGSSGTGTSSASGTAMTTNANDLLFGANTVKTRTAGAGAGYTSRVITTPDGDIAEDRVVTATGTYGATAPLAKPGSWVMQMVAFKAAVSPAP